MPALHASRAARVPRRAGPIDWSADSAGVDPRKASKAEIDRLRQLLFEAGADELSRLRDRQLLEALGLLATDGNLTMAAVLLVGKEALIAEVVPSYGYSYQYRPSPGSEATQRIRGAKPLLAAVEALMEAVDARTQVRPLNVAGGYSFAWSTIRPMRSESFS